MNTEFTALTEQHISELVRRFYQRASANENLSGIFEAVITDWDAHHRVVENFWSHALLNTDRYQGSPYPQHTRLPLRLEHFDIWLGLFRDTVREVLPTEAADRAIARAELMAESFKIGIIHKYSDLTKPSLAKPTV
jgi:hemoglobin